MKPAIVLGQSGGCTAVINASLAAAVEQARKIAPDWRVLGARHGIRGILGGEFLDLGQLDGQALGRLARTPAAALGSCRHKLDRGEAVPAVEQLKSIGARILIYIGGNDSADTAQRIHAQAVAAGVELAVIGVPKTIDNDLAVTDHTPGFGSAARYLASAIVDAGLDTESMRQDEPVKLFEVSGRNSGWLACGAALAKREPRDAPQFVWPAEAPFEADRFLNLTQNWLRKIGYCVIAVTETIRDAKGRHVAKFARTESVDAFGHPRVVGAAEFLCDLVSERLGVRARWEKMGTIGRTANQFVSPVDRYEARRLGAAAVRYALRGISGKEVVLVRSHKESYRCRIGLAPLEEIANAEKRVPASMFDRKRMLPTAEFARYAMPLIGAELPSPFRLPQERPASVNSPAALRR